MMYLFLRAIGSVLAKFPRFILSLRYLKKFHRKINLANPTLFYDILFWNSLYTDTSKWTELADKFLVRNYVEQKCGSSILTKLYGVYDAVSDIRYDLLPESFVIKTNNGCASNIIVRNKSGIDISKINNKLNYWLHFPYGELTGQTHYSRIKPKIVVEELLYQHNDPLASLIDYKFFCFHGKPLYCQVISNRIFNTHNFNIMMYDMEWNEHPEFFESNIILEKVPKPFSLSKMVEIASKLSNGFNFVRVDLYEINNKPMFGELTFLPGMSHNLTLEKQEELGNLI